LRSETIGTLNLFRAETTPLGENDLLLGAALADIATIGILHQRALRRSETVVEQLQGALNSRVVIEQAKGMLADRAGIDPDQAFTLLRNHARANHQLLSQLATQVINDRNFVTELLHNHNT
jgi:AmiR/NasT family two-component response regulator